MAAKTPLYDGINLITAGERLKEIRLGFGKTGMTQQELADLCGMPTDSYLSYYEKGKKDWRRSDYVVSIMQALKITAKQAREKFGMRVVIDPSVPAEHVPEVERPCSANVRFAGVIHAGNGDGSHVANDFVSVSLDLMGRFKPNDLFVVQVTGDSMTDEEAKRSIPEGSYVLLNSKLEPKRGDIVAAWLPEVQGSPDGIGVLKVFKRSAGDETSLESINPRGARFPMQSYPNAKIQGVYVAHWRVGRRG